jgi:hypothetical protein
MGSKTNTSVKREEVVEACKRYGKRGSQGSKEEKERFTGKGFGEVLVVYAVQEVSKTVSKGAQNGSNCPGNERCAVKSLPVRCRFAQLQPGGYDLYLGHWVVFPLALRTMGKP